MYTKNYSFDLYQASLKNIEEGRASKICLNYLKHVLDDGKTSNLISALKQRRQAIVDELYMIDNCLGKHKHE